MGEYNKKGLLPQCVAIFLAHFYYSVKLSPQMHLGGAVRAFLFRFLIPLLFLSFLAFTPEFIHPIGNIFRAVPQSDKLQHFFAGAACGAFGAMCYPLFGGRKVFAPILERNLTILLALLAGIAIGALWEVLEAKWALLGAMDASGRDTFFDLISDAFGALIAGLVYTQMRPLR